MKRIAIYLTQEQVARLSAIAVDRGISKAEVIRGILDQALNAGDADDEARAVIAATAGICADYPDWPDWLRSVRWGTGDERATRGAGDT